MNTTDVFSLPSSADNEPVLDRAWRDQFLPRFYRNEVSDEEMARVGLIGAISIAEIELIERPDDARAEQVRYLLGWAYLEVAGQHEPR
jgi:hypothetical protein